MSLPLQEIDINDAEVDSFYKEHYQKKVTTKGMLITKLGISFFIFFFSVLFLAYTSIKLALVLGVLGAVTFFLTANRLYKLIYSYILRNQLRYREVARAIDMGYAVNLEKGTPSDLAKHGLAAPIKHDLMEGQIFSSGHSRTINDILYDEKVTSFDYKYTTGSGKNQKTHYWDVVIFQLSKQLPHIFIDNRGNNSVWAGFKSSQKVSLESTFDSRFTLYAPDGYEVDSLSFISPEVIEELLKLDNKTDLEIIDNKLILFCKRKRNYKTAVVMCELARRLGAEFEDNIDTYRDTRLANNSSGHLGITASGKRLRKSYWPSIAGGAIFAVLALGYFVALPAAGLSVLILLAVLFDRLRRK